VARGEVNYFCFEDCPTNIQKRRTSVAAAGCGEGFPFILLRG